MIEAVEVHGTEIIGPVSVMLHPIRTPFPVELKSPCVTGIWLGIGLIIAPIVLGVIIWIVIFILVFLGSFAID